MDRNHSDLKFDHEGRRGDFSKKENLLSSPAGDGQGLNELNRNLASFQARFLRFLCGNSQTTGYVTLY